MNMLEALAFAGLSTTELLIVVLVIVLLFGASKIPQLMRGMGQGINEFKKGLKEGAKEESKEPESSPADAEKK
ncbi:MAG TPA: twin-arginine translocase TatA/TatE family subunit [Planctomycetota bacterium]|nr:twin-arginine translocase TatA/TatE family subunit [Planctomycetota bacterium]